MAICHWQIVRNVERRLLSKQPFHVCVCILKGFNHFTLALLVILILILLGAKLAAREVIDEVHLHSHEGYLRAGAMPDHKSFETGHKNRVYACLCYSYST